MCAVAPWLQAHGLGAPKQLPHYTCPIATTIVLLLGAAVAAGGLLLSAGAGVGEGGLLRARQQIDGQQVAATRQLGRIRRQERE